MGLGWLAMARRFLLPRSFIEIGSSATIFKCENTMSTTDSEDFVLKVVLVES